MFSVKKKKDDINLIKEIEDSEEGFLNECRATLKAAEDREKAIELELKAISEEEGKECSDELAVCGFINSKNTQNLKVKEKLEKERIDEASEQREQQRKIDSIKKGYKTKGLIYISDERLQIILKKYALVIGPSQWYIGSIPKKNREEIVNFDIKKIDEVYRRYTHVQYDYFEVRSSPQSNGNNINNSHFKGSMCVVAERKDFLENKEYDAENNKMGLPVPDDPIVMLPVSTNTYENGWIIVSHWEKETEILKKENII